MRTPAVAGTVRLVRDPAGDATYVFIFLRDRDVGIK